MFAHLSLACRIQGEIIEKSFKASSEKLTWQLFEHAIYEDYRSGLQDIVAEQDSVSGYCFTPGQRQRDNEMLHITLTLVRKQHQRRQQSWASNKRNNQRYNKSSAPPGRITLIPGSGKSGE